MLVGVTNLNLTKRQDCCEWLIGKNIERSCHGLLRLYPNIRLEGLKKSSQSLNYSRPPVRIRTS